MLHYTLHVWSGCFQFIFSYTASKSDELSGIIWFASSPKFQSCNDPAGLLLPIPLFICIFPQTGGGVASANPHLMPCCSVTVFSEQLFLQAFIQLFQIDTSIQKCEKWGVFLCPNTDLLLPLYYQK